MKSSNKQLRNSTITILPEEMRKWLGVLLWVLRADKPFTPYYLMIDRILLNYKTFGPVQLVKYLKESHRLLMVWYSGKPSLASIGVPVGLALGVPKIIPGPLRLLMRRGDRKVFRIVLTILSVYRVIKCDSVLKLSTITSPFMGLTKTLPLKEIGHISGILNQKFNKFKLKLLHITTAGPNHSISSLSAPWDSIAIMENQILYDSFTNLCYRWGFGSLLDMLREEYDLVKGTPPFRKNQDTVYAGKLSTKEEAAGKVRVFAITDWWTQNLLYPLHLEINRILRTIPQDGTFNQDKPIRELTSKVGSSYMVSYDLSAATDRLPIDLQVDILSQFIPKSQAQSWADLLIKRDWHLKGEGILHYSVGQPMGAYSSFAMLALSHHYIVQIAALRSYPDMKVWFENYALLGDDIVIADPKVASHYLYIMRETLGVEINLSKSLESTIGVSEFAKRLMSPEGEVSAIGPKVLLQSIRDASFIPTLITDVINKGVDISYSTIDLMFNESLFFARRVRDFTLPKILWVLLTPFGKIPSDRLLPLLMCRSSYSQEELKKFHGIVSYFVMTHYHKLEESGSIALSKAYQALLKSLNEPRGLIPSDVLIQLPSSKFLVNKYRLATVPKTPELRKKVWDFFYSFGRGEPWSLDDLPVLLSEPRPSLINLDEIDDHTKITETGKTAFKLIRKIHQEFGVPSVKPVKPGFSRTTNTFKELEVINNKLKTVKRPKILLRTYDI